MPSRFLILFVTTFLTLSSHASPYYRFWQGWKLDSLNYDQFRTAIDETFVPATVEVGQGKGLISYTPVLLPLPKNRPSDLVTLPDEIALVVYSSEADYRRLRETQEGKEYSDLHWKYFDKAKGSQSIIPEPYISSLETNHAYDILQSEGSWQKGHVVHSVSKIKGSVKNYVDLVKSWFPKRGLKSYVILVGNSYVIEYQLWADKNSYLNSKSKLIQLRSDALDVLPMTEESRNLVPYKSDIQYGEGVNTQFNSQKEVVTDPLNFSERSTQAFAENTSDMEPFGLDGCDYTNIDEIHPSIACMGTKTVLVHGGHEVTGEFTCDFKFTRTPTGKYLVVTGTETCQ